MGDGDKGAGPARLSPGVNHVPEYVGAAVVAPEEGGRSGQIADTVLPERGPGRKQQR